MAYADTIARPNPSSLAAAIVVNALMITGIIFAAPHITGDTDAPSIIFTELYKPKPVETKVEPHATKPVPGQTVQPQPDLRPAASRSDSASDNGIATTGTGSITNVTDDDVPSIIEERVEPVPPLLTLREATINPRFRSAFQPEYPPALIRQDIEGAVTIRVLIGTDGRVRQVEPVRFDDPELLRATQTHALRKWRFLPATRGGEPVESWREMTVRFEIPD